MMMIIIMVFWFGMEKFDADRRTEKKRLKREIVLTRIHG